MHIIVHRRNTIAELRETPTHFGVEVDIRSNRNQLIIHHDPFEPGVAFEEWLSAYQHGTLILNVKEESLEKALLQLMEKYNIPNFFFLDQSFPFLVKWASQGERRCAVRVSEYENINTALSLAGKIDWVWIDCFSHFPLNQQDAIQLKNSGFKLCLVSPELQGRNAETEIPAFRTLLKQRMISPDAVCTKRPELWTTSSIQN